MFGREEELRSLRARLARRRSFLFHGPSGVGKSLLLKAVLPDCPRHLYCEHAASSQDMFRRIAAALVRAHDATLQQRFGDRAEALLGGRSAVALKGIISDALQAGGYSLVLDHLSRPSQALASVVRELSTWTSTPVVGVARSAHMEDVGFLRSMFADRSEKLEIKNFDDEEALAFANQVASERGLTAMNQAEFLKRVLDFSGGNPGMIIALVEMATLPKYRSNDYVKISPLYIDFRLRWNAPTSR